jgi:hypothetical protein
MDQKERLKQLNDEVLQRYGEVKGMFEGKDISPVGHADFMAFIHNHLAFLNMHYVVFGTVPDVHKGDEYDPSHAKEEQIKNAGFAVSGNTSVKTVIRADVLSHAVDQGFKAEEYDE